MELRWIIRGNDMVLQFREKIVSEFPDGWKPDWEDVPVVNLEDKMTTPNEIKPFIHVGRKCPKGSEELAGSMHLGKGIWSLRCQWVKDKKRTPTTNENKGE